MKKLFSILIVTALLAGCELTKGYEAKDFEQAKANAIKYLPNFLKVCDNLGGVNTLTMYEYAVPTNYGPYILCNNGMSMNFNTFIASEKTK